MIDYSKIPVEIDEKTRDFNLEVLQAATSWSTDMLESCARHEVPLQSITPDPRDVNAVYEHFMKLISSAPLRPSELPQSPL